MQCRVKGRFFLLPCYTVIPKTSLTYLQRSGRSLYTSQVVPAIHHPIFHKMGSLLSSSCSFSHAGNAYNHDAFLQSRRGVSTAANQLKDQKKNIQNNSFEEREKNDNKSSLSTMKDEYGKMDSSGETFTVDEFLLEGGDILRGAQVRYSSFGNLNEKKDNVLVVCHALTGNSRLDQWWGGLLGPGLPFDTDKYFIICANVLGSCYGSSGPTSINPDTGDMWGKQFPKVTIRDTVRIHMRMVSEYIGASHVACVVGGSMGGMQALEWALLGGSFVKSVVVIGCGASHTAWQIAISETQRQAIYADPKWRGGDIDLRDPPAAGLSVARQIAMVSYRTPHAYQSKFGRAVNESGDFEAKSYLQYQGMKFLDRFDALTYVKITEQMDTHDVGRGRGGIDAALASITSRVMVMGIDSDLLYPLCEQEELAKKIPQCTFKVIKSKEGHDGFLLEQKQVADNISLFLNGGEDFAK